MTTGESTGLERAVTETVDWTAGYQRRSVEIGGGTISYLQLTESMRRAGTPTVLVHGIKGCALEHCALGRALAPRGPVYLLDLRLHGHSTDAPANPISGSLNDQVFVVTSFLREVVRAPVLLVGNSFGAMVVAHVTRFSPEDVERVVLIGPAVRPARRPVDLKRYLQWVIVQPQWVRDRFDAGVRAGKPSEDPDSFAAGCTPHVDLIPAAFTAALGAAPVPVWSADNPTGRTAIWRGLIDTMVVLGHPRRWMGLLNSLTPPALWLHGTDDPMMPAASAEEIRRLLAAWQVATIALTGHVPHLERTEWTAARIDEWLGAPLR